MPQKPNHASLLHSFLEAKKMEVASPNLNHKQAMELTTKKWKELKEREKENILKLAEADEKREEKQPLKGGCRFFEGTRISNEMIPEKGRAESLDEGVRVMRVPPDVGRHEMQQIQSSSSSLPSALPHLAPLLLIVTMNLHFFCWLYFFPTLLSEESRTLETLFSLLSSSLSLLSSSRVRSPSHLLLS